VEYGGRVIETNDCWLNITAEDYGIEVDRVAKISVPGGATLLDGETLGGREANRIVGLFEIDCMNRFVDQDRTTADASDVEPQRFFFSGTEQQDLESCLALQREHRSKHDKNPDFEANRMTGRLRLCPITYGIVRRCARLLERREYEGRRDCFICFGREDEPLAQRVNQVVKAHQFTTFFSGARGSDIRWFEAIDSALRTARCLIVVGTAFEHFVASWTWPYYEWATFYAKRFSAGTGKIICFIPGLDLKGLPDRLGDERVIIVCNSDTNAALQELGKVLSY
jgi:hypothetical protein